MEQANKHPVPPLHFSAVTVIAALAVLFSCTTSSDLPLGEAVPAVRVCLNDEHTTARLYFDKDAFLIGTHTQRSIREADVYECALTEEGGILVTRGGKRIVEFAGTFRCWYPDPKQRFGFEGNRYSDTLLLTTDGRNLFVINKLPVERYLESVVPNEIGRRLTEREFSAAEAQAVIARTYALTKIDLPVKRLFDVYDDTRDQVFTGMMKRTRITSRAVRESRGRVLMDGRLYAESYFHAVCGGRTESAGGAWPGHDPKPYLVSSADRGPGGDYCRNAGSYRWAEEYTRSEIEEILREYIPAASDEYTERELSANKALLDIKVTERTLSGRVHALRIYMGEPSDYETFEIRGDKIRYALRRPGTERILRSTLFDIELERDAQQWITAVRLNGGGNGHGVGMCQWGAIGRARNGAGAEDILEAYFPGTSVTRVY